MLLVALVALCILSAVMLWFLCALSGQISEDEERERGIRRS